MEPPFRHERGRGARHGYQRVGAHVLRQEKSFAAGLVKRPAEILGIGERQAMHHRVQGTPQRAERFGQLIDLFILGNVAGQ